MRVLFALLGEIGHVNPFVGIAQSLAHAGHHLAVHAPRNFGAQLIRAGAAAEWFGETDERLFPPDKMAARMRDPRWLARWYELALATIPRSIASIQAAVRGFRPDVLCVDPLNLAAAIVAEQQQLPWAAVSTNFAAVRPDGWSCPFIDVGIQMAPRIRELLDANGASLAIEGADVVSPWFNSVFTTEALVPRDQTSNRHSRYVGPARCKGARGDEPEFPWDRLDERPLVYVSSGGGQSLAFDAECLIRIATALGSEEAIVVLAAQHLHDDSVFRAALPGNCVVTRYAPQEKLLDRAAVAVTHGGVSSVNECLWRGCPMLVLPLGKEQPLQAELVQRRGAGLAFDPRTLTDDTCRDALRTLLAGGTYRERAGAIRDSYRATDSTAVICRAIEQLARGERE
jgi:zeaxanthin glucosyltransferase